MHRNRFLILSLILLLFNCKSVKVSKEITKIIESPFYDNQFTGLLVYNPKTGDTIYSYNANKYFTPASNTKIFTLYTALNLLPNKIPAFKYVIDADTIIMQGTGNPTFLHTIFNDSTALKTAKQYKKVHLLIDNYKEDKLGPGWAWEDYDTYFSAERSSFPIYGNVVTIFNNAGLESIPKALQKNIQIASNKFRRDLNQNQFFYNAKKNDTIEVPMVMDSLLQANLWNAILPNKVSLFNYSYKKPNEIVYSSTPADSLYKHMLEVSDNFIAEQMLIMSSAMISDTLSSKKAMDYMFETKLSDLKQKPRWVDGSGLSRYNLFTPTSFVQVLSKMYAEIPHERLFNLFPAGGVSGTLKKYYSGESKPYIYAKSGTVGNNYSLSGYLITNKGATLIFSFMNNHYKNATTDIKKHMQLVFEWLRDNY